MALAADDADLLHVGTGYIRLSEWTEEGITYWKLIGATRRMDARLYLFTTHEDIDNIHVVLRELEAELFNFTQRHPYIHELAKQVHRTTVEQPGLQRGPRRIWSAQQSPPLTTPDPPPHTQT